MVAGAGATAAVALAVLSGSPEIAALSLATTGVLANVAAFAAPGVVAAAEAASAMTDVTDVSVACALAASTSTMTASTRSARRGVERRSHGTLPVRIGLSTT